MLNQIFTPYDQRMTLALAGVWQSAALVTSLADTGNCDSAGYDRALKSVLNVDPKRDNELFGHGDDMLLGLKHLHNFVSGKTAATTETRYAVQIIQLQKNFLKNPKVQMQVRTGLEHASRQAEMYGYEDDNLIRNLGRLYQDNLSPLMQIQIMGKHQFLQQEIIAARVRMLLFSGVRFSHLWRQTGGHSIHLISARSKIRAMTTELLK